MNKEEFIKIRSKYNRDIDCIKGEKISKDQFYFWKQEFGLSKRSKKDQKRKADLAKMSKEEFLKIRNQYNSNEECAKALGLGKDAYYVIKKQLGLTLEYDHSEIDKEKFLELYNQGKNDAEISKELGTNGKRINAFRRKLNLSNNVEKNLEFTDEQYQIFVGGMLGDSSMSIPKDGANAYFTFAHSLKQEGYALWKHSKLENLCFKAYRTKEYDKRNGNIYEDITVRSYTNKLFTSYLDKFYYRNESGKKIKYINEEILNTLTDLGVAVWFMDDGFKNHRGYSISTNCFSAEDIKIICKFFIDKYNIHPTVHKNNTIYIGAKYRNEFTKIVKPYIHKDLIYKLHSCPD